MLIAGDCFPSSFHSLVFHCEKGFHIEARALQRVVERNDLAGGRQFHSHAAHPRGRRQTEGDQTH